MHPQNCKNCQQPFTGNFCNNCGEKRFVENDKKISRLFEEGFHFVTHFEGTFFTSLKTILRSPGKFSLDFCNGIQKKYFKPISFFLLLVILYLLFPVFEGLNMRLHFHAQSEIYGSLVKQKVATLMAEKNISFEQLSDLFHQKGEKVSKILLPLIIPFMACISWLLLFKKRPFYYDHFIFTTESCSVLLLWGFLILPLLIVFVQLITPNKFLQGDYITGPLIILGVLLHCCIASIRFFNLKVWQALLFSLIYICILVLFIQYIYKFLLYFFSIIQI